MPGRNFAGLLPHPNMAVLVRGWPELEATVAQFGPRFAADLCGPSLGRAAAVVRRRAKSANFVFRDRRGPRGEGTGPGEGKYKSLRQSIRSRRISGGYGGRRFRHGRAAVYAGGPGARQAHLVHEGHGGPWKARPYPFIRLAQMITEAEQESAFGERMKELFPRLVSRYTGRTRTPGLQRSIGTTFGRTLARRGRRRY